MSRDGRQRAERHGRIAEIYVALIYCLCGFRILARRYRTTSGEADLILRRVNLVVVVEVKYAGAGQVIDTVLPSFRQLKRIEKAALIFQSRHPEYANAMLRLDIIVVRPWGRFRRIRNAGSST